MSITRAVVLIGVQNAKQLPKLQAAWSATAAMKNWALAQSIDPALIRTLTDENGKDVRVRDVQDVITDLVDRGDIEQLIVYFSGHGINVGRNEYWLLTDAIANGAEAVNLKASMELAEFGPIPHVVFVSDACRSAATGIGQQIITGSTIYPQKFHAGLSKAVDVFYATLLGRPALEIADPNDAASQYEAVYTDAFVEALNGRHAQAIEKDPGTNQDYVRPRPLKSFLQSYLPVAVFQRLGAAGGRSQQPDARITSDDDAWLAEITQPPVPSGAVTGAPDASPDAEALAYGEAASLIAAMPAAALEITMTGDYDRLNALVDESRAMPGRFAPEHRALFTTTTLRFVDDVERNETPVGPMHFETGSGFKLRGDRVRDCIAVGTTPEILADGELVRLVAPRHSATNVLLILSDGRSVLLPAIDEFLATLTFDEDGLADVAYEPVDTSDRWGPFNARMEELRRLRAVVAASSQMGSFRLEGENAEQMSRRMQLAKGVDPSLAIYAAHAYRDQGMRDRIRSMADYLQGDIGIVFFDIALLAQQLGPDTTDEQRQHIFPFLPLLTQTWALLPAWGITLPDGLAGIERHISTTSLWTLFDAEGTQRLAASLREGSPS